MHTSLFRISRKVLFVLSIQIDPQLSSTTIDTSSYVPNEAWALEPLPAKRNVVKYDCCPEEYVDITFYLKLTRRGSSDM